MAMETRHNFMGCLWLAGLLGLVLLLASCSPSGDNDLAPLPDAPSATAASAAPGDGRVAGYNSLTPWGVIALFPRFRLFEIFGFVIVNQFLMRFWAKMPTFRDLQFCPYLLVSASFCEELAMLTNLRSYCFIMLNVFLRWT
jgi:hypothetical protein